MQLSPTTLLVAVPVFVYICCYQSWVHAEEVASFVCSSKVKPGHTNICHVLLQVEDPAANQDLVSAVFNLAGRYMLMAPAPALASGALLSLFRWSIRAVQLREAEAVRPVIVFLSRWAAPPSGSVLSDADRAVSSSMHILHGHICYL